MKRIIIWIGILFAAVSCESFLDMQPTSSANAAQAIQTPSDAGVALNGIMRSLTSSSLYGRNLLLYTDAKGGDLTIYSAGRGLDGLYSFNHSATSNSYSGYWSSGFYLLMQINNLIGNIERLEEAGEGGFDYYMGAALTLRAMLAFDLVRLYGAPYTRNPSAFGIPDAAVIHSAGSEPGRLTVAENYRQIISDLESGATRLSSDKSRRNGQVGYYANRALQARVRLFMRDFAGALAASEEVINDGGYKLYEPQDWAASWSKQYGSESILELGIDTEADLTTASLGFYYVRYHQFTNAQGWFLASDYFLNRLGEDPQDVRWGVMDSDESVEKTGVERKGACYKYVGGIAAAGDGKETRTAVNIKLFRLSEMYLISAEAALHSASPDRALAASRLNAIRRRSPNLAPVDAGTVSDALILSERSKELFGEGHRFFDRIRAGESIEFNDDFQDVPVSGRSKVISPDFQRIILPIPQDEINANRTIASQQNPGY